MGASSCFSRAGEGNQSEILEGRDGLWPDSRSGNKEQQKAFLEEVVQPLRRNPLESLGRTRGTEEAEGKVGEVRYVLRKAFQTRQPLEAKKRKKSFTFKRT